MGEKENKPFQLTFNGFLKVDFQGSRVTSDGGLILIRELDERLGLGKLIDEHLTDSRQGTNKKAGYPLDSGDPKILWLGSKRLVPLGEDRAVRRRLHCHGLLHQPVEELAATA